ncbi:transcriptional regulator, TrmB [sediment metagenome]|uniref:Transcriptional regulator, TrmB n=1 Tax=sediment metagenome TaxID=749907 RepID=D9PN94_9ZZZZ
MDLNEKNLCDLGLKVKEARVYLATLELGQSLVTDISQKAAVNRTSGYHILERLCVRGLVIRTSGQGAKRKYAAEPPAYLLNIYEGKQKNLTRKIEKIKTLLPALNNLYKDKNKPVIKFYDGSEGIKKVYLETLKSKEEILAVGDIDEWENPVFNKWIRQYAKKRAARKIYERGLITATEKSAAWVNNYPATKKYSHFRWLPKDRFPYLGSEVDIYEDKVVVVLLKKPNYLGVLIQSAELARIMKTLFELAWEAAEKYN